MGRVTELHVREDWGLVRLIYVPALALALSLSRWLPLLAVVTIRINPCFLCWLVSRWGHQIEEYYNAKPILQITDNGIVYEDGCEPVEYGWAEITGVVMFRRNNIPPWRTDGSTEIAPPYWLAVSVRDPDYEPDDGAVFREEDRYSQRSRRPEGGVEIQTEGVRAITVWPRQVVGGLLIRRADEGEIPLLLRQGN